MSIIPTKSERNNKNLREKRKNLLLSSIELMNYRCFDKLKIERLGRVNLIVGKNNVGKTTLLEGIRIYLERARLNLLVEILQSRNEAPQYAGDTKDLTESFLSLFSNRKLVPSNELILRKSARDRNRLRIKILSGDEFNFLANQKNLFGESDSFANARTFHLQIEKGKNDVLFPLNEGLRRLRFVDERRNSIDNLIIQFVQAQGLNEEEIAKLWDNVVLTELEEFAISSLQMIAPNVQRISFRGDERRNRRVPIVKTDENERPFALKSLGEGMNRMLGIALALANSQNSALLVDEIESGLHYSVLPDVWKLIFKTAKELNVQVFATTHSYDCIEAFSKAAIDDKTSEGMLVRLARKDDEIKAFAFDEKQLKTITKEKIEVR